MATVRFSKELIDQIVANARAKMAPAIEKAKAQRPDPSWGQRIYDIMFGDLKPIIARLPAGWMKTVDDIRIEYVGSTKLEMTFSLNGAQPWPYTFHTTEYATKRQGWGDPITLTDHAAWDEFKAEAVAYDERVKAAIARSQEFVEMVKQVCNAYTTLAPALKAWPPLWELIPEAYKDKHREIKERTKSEVKLEVDLGKLTAMSTAAKFGL